MTEATAVEDAFWAEAGRLEAERPDLGPLARGMLAGANLGIASDSRTFARMFGFEHALVVREVHALSEAGMLVILDHDRRTQRCRYEFRAESFPSSIPNQRN